MRLVHAVVPAVRMVACSALTNLDDLSGSDAMNQVADVASVAINGADAGTIHLPPVYSPGAPNPTAGLGFETASADQFSVYIDNTVVWIE